MDLPTITFEQLPAVLAQVRADVAFIKEHLSQNNQTPQPPADQWFDIDDLSDYTRLSKPTIYGKKDIPYHKQGKRLMFLKSEIDEWLKQGKRQTVITAAADADTFLSTNKKARA